MRFYRSTPYADISRCLKCTRSPPTLLACDGPMWASYRRTAGTSWARIRSASKPTGSIAPVCRTSIRIFHRFAGSAILRPCRRPDRGGLELKSPRRANNARAWQHVLSGAVFQTAGCLQRCDNLLFGQPRAVIAFDQQGYAATVIDVPCPVHGLVERAELFVQVAILLQRRDRLRAAWPGIDAVGHRRISCMPS